MGFEKFNRGLRFNPINTEGYEYKKLEELYQVKTRIVYIPEVGRKVCVVAEQ